MTLQEIQYKAQGIIHKWRDDDSAPYIEFVEELAHMIVPEQSEDLEEAAWDCVLDSVDVNNPVLLPKYKVLLTSIFIDGAKWQKEQMMKEAIDGMVDFEYFGYKVIRPDLKQLDALLESMNHGDKVRVIVLKKED